MASPLSPRWGAAAAAFDSPPEVAAAAVGSAACPVPLRVDEEVGTLTEDDRSAAGKQVSFGPTSPLEDVLTFYSVTHDLLGDPFWAVYRRGLADAARRFACRVHHRAPDQFSAIEMAKHLEAAVDGHPDGIVATIPDLEAVESVLRAAIEAGIPVIAVNAADPRPLPRRIPYLNYVGASDAVAGEEVARRFLRAERPRAAVCFDHYLQEHVCHHARYTGFARVMQEAGVPAWKVRIPGQDVQQSAEIVHEHVRAHRPDAICTLGPPGSAAVASVIEDEGLRGRVHHASFDLAHEQLVAIRSGTLDFTVDSQQYLQGFLGIALLWLRVTKGLTLADDLLTGPAFVDRDGLGDVEAGIRDGYR